MSIRWLATAAQPTQHHRFCASQLVGFPFMVSNLPKVVATPENSLSLFQVPSASPTFIHHKPQNTAHLFWKDKHRLTSKAGGKPRDTRRSAGYQPKWAHISKSPHTKQLFSYSAYPCQMHRQYRPRQNR